MMSFSLIFMDFQFFKNYFGPISIKLSRFFYENRSKVVIFPLKYETYDSIRAFRCSVFRSRTFLRSAFMLPFQLVSFSFSNSVTGLFLFSGQVFFFSNQFQFSVNFCSLYRSANFCGHNWINRTIFIYALIRLVLYKNRYNVLRIVVRAY